MLHELLLALSGHGGSLFIEKTDFKFDVINDIPFFHPSEVSIIRQLLSIGSYFKVITHFRDTYENALLVTDQSNQTGQYITALASSFYEVVEQYEATIIALEQDILEDPDLPLSHLLLALQPQSHVLAAIAQLITQVKEDDIRGCKILEIVHQHVALSVGRTKEVLIRVEQSVHVVLYEQLTHWLLYGLLLDPHNELFIKATMMAVPTTNTSSSSSVPDLETLSLTDVDQPKMVQEISLRAEMLPDHIPLEIAEKILFIGEAILEFEGENKKNQELMTSTALVTSHSGQVLKGREEEFLSMIRDLIAAHTFSLSNFSAVVESIRNCVSEQLWTLVMEAGLLDELTDIKSIFLLGRGELYQAFITTATPRLNHTLAGSSYLNSLMKAAGRQVLLDDVLEKFTLSLSPYDPSNTEQRGSVWNYLRINYNATWPLNKLFNDAVQDKYNKIFVFLLDVRRAQYRLQHLWISQMQTKKISTSKYETLLWTIRHHMTLLIDNLQYYLQVDVLESQYWQLISDISKTRDYQKLVSAHHNFLACLQYQCFLNNPIIYATLCSLISQVHEFCQFMENDVALDESLSENFMANSSLEKKVAKINKEFEDASRLLFDILSSLKHTVGTRHTAQLIMRIDYNRYYSLNNSNMKFTAEQE